jgi:hypothetical protein
LTVSSAVQISIAGSVLRGLSWPGRGRFRHESYHSVRILLLNLQQICVQPVEISAEFCVELASRFASLFNDWIFHDIDLLSD